MSTNRKFGFIFTHWHFRKKILLSLAPLWWRKGYVLNWIAALCIGMSRLTLLNSQEREKVSIEGTQQNGWSARPSPALPRLCPVPLSSGLPKNLPFYDFILMAILEKDLWQQIISQSLLANFMVCSLTIAFNDQEHSADSAPQKHPSFRTRLQSKYPVLHWETLQ